MQAACACDRQPGSVSACRRFGHSALVGLFHLFAAAATGGADDCIGVGKEPVNRNQSRNAREQRQQGVVGYAGVGEDSVLRDAVVDA
jgi:hypothetical protein